MAKDRDKWVGKVREKMEPMFNRLNDIPFRQYLAAGTWLSKILAEKRERFWAVADELLWKSDGGPSSPEGGRKGVG